jgi:predicted dehydrogenase
MIRLGIAGCGRVTTTRHLPALQGIKNVQIVGLADRLSDRVNSAAQQYRVPRIYAGIEGLIEDPEINAIAVCLPPEYHYEAAAMVLRAKKHLFLEKPIALQLSDSQKLVDLASGSKCISMMGFNLRWHRLVRNAKRLLDQGVIGRVLLVHSKFTSGSMVNAQNDSWREHHRTGGGVLSEQAIHHFDLWRYFFECGVQNVSSVVSNESTAVVAARLESGPAVCAAFTQASAPENEIDIYGSAGRLLLSLYRRDGLMVLPFTAHSGDLSTRSRQLAGMIASLPSTLIDPGGDYIHSYKNEWIHFLECIRNNQTPGCTLLDGHYALETLKAALDADSLPRTPHEFA